MEVRGEEIGEFQGVWENYRKGSYGTEGELEEGKQGKWAFDKQWLQWQRVEIREWKVGVMREVDVEEGTGCKGWRSRKSKGK